MKIYDYVDTPWGRGLAAVENGRLVDLRFTASKIDGVRKPLPAVKSMLGKYFRGERVRFGSVRMPGNTPFARRVYKAVASIPFGEVRTYGQIARQAGRPKAARAVGQLMANNPLVLVIPCHRVVAAGGKLGGFTGGIKRKRFLLALESSDS